jgi:hypothetical protein
VCSCIFKDPGYSESSTTTTTTRIIIIIIIIAVGITAGSKEVPGRKGL